MSHPPFAKHCSANKASKIAQWNRKIAKNNNYYELSLSKKTGTTAIKNATEQRL
jgi:hypothetical protein